jgi:PAS domain S-box-containing protein
MEPGGLLSRLEFLENRISSVRDGAYLANAELAKDSQDTLNAALEEIGIVRKVILAEVKQVAARRIAVEHERARYHDLFEFAPDAYLVTDLRGHIQQANESSAAIFRAAKQSVVGKPLMLFVESKAAAEMAARARTCPPDEPQHFASRLRRMDGTVAEALVSVSVDQKRGMILWLVRDISRGGQATDRVPCPALLIGASPAMLAVKKQIEAVIPFPTVTVLLEGETGTGKELIAGVLHDATYAGSKAPFVPISCPAIPDHLLESELFGHEKGAFTDARSKKPGLFELANGGTLFLDEVSTLSASLQPKLLRVLETKSFTRLGGLNRIKINCRIMCATNKPLHDLVEEGKFREDLYYRLSTFTISIPPLRDRSGDVSLIAHVLIEQTAGTLGKKVRGITPEALAVLEAYHWPGNVRELKKIIERAVILTPATEPINTTVFPKEILTGNSSEPAPAVGLRDLEKQHLVKILATCRDNKSHAAKLLGISRTTLRKKLQE